MQVNHIVTGFRTSISIWQISASIMTFPKWVLVSLMNQCWKQTCPPSKFCCTSWVVVFHLSSCVETFEYIPFMFWTQTMPIWDVSFNVCWSLHRFLLAFTSFDYDEISSATYSKNLSQILSYGCFNLIICHFISLPLFRSSVSGWVSAWSCVMEPVLKYLAIGSLLSVQQQLFRSNRVHIEKQCISDLGTAL